MSTNWKDVMATVLCVGVWCLPALAQTPRAATLEVDLENVVLYNYDTYDYPKLASTPSVTTPLPMKAFALHAAVGDIVAVNGKPAKGTWLGRYWMFSLRPDAAPSQTMADITRSMWDDYVCEFLQVNGTPVGTVLYSGLAGGSPTPGAPLAQTSDNFAITGGTGPFLGMRGQAGAVVSTRPTRIASVTEDPANRRTLGGGAFRIILHLLPMSWPDVVLTATGPAVAHSSDFTPVSTTNPAKSGEILSLVATGLGPTKPGIDPGKAFAADRLYLVNSPVEIIVNGMPAEVLYAGGYPGTTNTYQVNFRLPSGITSGTVTLQLSAAWIAGSEVKIPVE